MINGNKFTNQQIAKLLHNVSAAYLLKKGNRFKIMAYDRAATSIKQATSEAKDLWDDGKLDEIPGIGSNIATHLDELFTTGKVVHFEKVLSGLPPAMFEFLDIPGIGAKTALKLCQNLGIKKKEKALERLKRAAKEGKIRVIEGFGKQSEREILEGLAGLGRQEKRLTLAFAFSKGKEILDYLKECKFVLQADLLGSLRRKCATVGDIDIAVASKHSQKVVKHFISYSKKRKVLEAGKNKARILLTGNIQVDLMVEKPTSYGSLLQHFTGSKQHNIALREIAQKKGLSLSEHGMKKRVAGGGWQIDKYSSEKAFYKTLGMEWIPPELRENRGEIKTAQKGKIPHLLELKDIKGDLHIHSDFDIETSHDLGASPLKDIYKKAQQLDYQYISLTEHNPSMSKHSDQEIIDLIKRKKEHIEQFLLDCKKNKTKRSQKVNIFNSLEVDIKPTGKRAISDKALEKLDFAIVSIHSSFKMNRKEMTVRILKALDHPKVKILGHPTGRKLNVREAYEIDWEKLFDFCLKKKKVLEINAYPDRLDLPDRLIKEAVDKGILLAVNSDSHHVSHMSLIKYGVWTARRGWAKKSDILNTLGYDKIKKELMF